MNIVFRFFLVIIFCWVSSSASFQSLTDKIRIRPDLPADQVIKVWVFFTDKGGGDVSLAKCVPVTDKALWRRAMRGADVDNTFYDREVNPVYVSATEPLVEKIGYPSRWLNAVSVEVKTAKLSKLADLPFVRRITEVAKFIRKPVVADDNLGFRKPAVTTDHDYGDSYNQLNQIRVIDLHHQGLSGAGVTILMLDSGYKVSHQAFSHLDIDSTYDFINNDPDVEDSSGYIDQQYHGTMTLSVIGGLTEGEVIGVAYDATYLLAKTEISHDNIEIEIEEDYWVAGIEWGEHLGADVVSSSLGYSDWYTYEDMDGKSAVTTVAADIAASLGVIVVNSMGNGGRTAAKPTLIAPADGDSVIAVGAVDFEGSILGFSSNGPSADGRIKPDLCAQGSGVRVAVLEGYSYGSGTSFSCPLVAGVVALLLEARPNWDYGDVYAALTATASHADNSDSVYGYGVVNAPAALGAAAVDHVVAYPNPCSTSITFEFPVSEPGEVSVQIFTVAAEEVITIKGKVLSGKSAALHWNGCNQAGEEVAAGIYIAYIQGPNINEITKLFKL